MRAWSEIECEEDEDEDKDKERLVLLLPCERDDRLDLFLL
jgi:hypothetical protein